MKVFGPEYSKREKLAKKDFYLEDDVAKNFANCIIDKDLKKKMNLIPAKLGEGTLQCVAKAKLPAFKNSLFLLDGDVSIRAGCTNVLKLPGEKSPELIAFEFLTSLSKDDKFWGDAESGYTRQFCFRDCSNSTNHNEVKRWYKNQKKCWGKNASILWDKWRESNKNITDDFNCALKERVKEE